MSLVVSLLLIADSFLLAALNTRTREPSHIPAPANACLRSRLGTHKSYTIPRAFALTSPLRFDGPKRTTFGSRRRTVSERPTSELSSTGEYNGRAISYPDADFASHSPFNLSVPYKALFTKFESILLQHSGRPHWAKSHNCSRTMLQEMYPKLGDFLEVRERVDPQGVLLNAYTRRHLLGELGEQVDMRRYKALKRVAY